MQTLLFYACCFTDKTGYYKSKLASFTEYPGCHRLSLCMSFACRIAAKLGPCCQPCFSVTDLLLLPAPHMRYKRFLRQRSRTQKGVLVDLLCSEGPPLKHRVVLGISIGARTRCWSDGPYCISKAVHVSPFGSSMTIQGRQATCPVTVEQMNSRPTW